MEFPDIISIGLKDYIEENLIDTYDLSQIKVNSKKKAMFKCKICGNAYETTFNTFILHRDICESCTDLRNKYKHKQTLYEWFFEITNTTNVITMHNMPLCEVDLGSVLASSKDKIWFMCNKGHKFRVSPYNITHNMSWCPICSKHRHISKPEVYIYNYLCDIFDDIEQQRECKYNNKRSYDIYIPSRNIAIEFDGEEWHKDLEHDFEKDLLARKEEVTLIRIKEASTKENVVNIKKFIREHKDVIKDNWVVIHKKINNNEAMIHMLYLLQDKLKIHLIGFPQDVWKRAMSDFYLGIKPYNLEQGLITYEIDDKFDYIHNSIRPEYISMKENKFKFWMICSKCGQSYEITPYDLIIKGQRHCK